MREVESVHFEDAWVGEKPYPEFSGSGVFTNEQRMERESVHAWVGENPYPEFSGSGVITNEHRMEEREEDAGGLDITTPSVYYDLEYYLQFIEPYDPVFVSNARTLRGSMG